MRITKDSLLADKELQYYRLSRIEREIKQQGKNYQLAETRKEAERIDKCLVDQIQRRDEIVSKIKQIEDLLNLGVIEINVINQEE